MKCTRVRLLKLLSAAGCHCHQSAPPLVIPLLTQCDLQRAICLSEVGSGDAGRTFSIGYVCSKLNYLSMQKARGEVDGEKRGGREEKREKEKRALLVGDVAWW